MTWVTTHCPRHCGRIESTSIADADAVSTPLPNHSSRTKGWIGLQRRHRAHPVEWLAERFIFAVSLSTIALLLLIVLFVGREIVPLLLGRTNSALIQRVIPSADMDQTPPGELRRYLGMSPSQFRDMDRETLRAIMKTREEADAEISPAFRGDPDSRINTTEWRYLLAPHRWSGYDRPEFVWQPVGTIQIARDGRPIVIMPDGPAVGGYPKIGILDPSALPRLAQRAPGERVRFCPVGEAS